MLFNISGPKLAHTLGKALVGVADISKEGRDESYDPGGSLTKLLHRGREQTLIRTRLIPFPAFGNS